MHAIDLETLHGKQEVLKNTKRKGNDRDESNSVDDGSTSKTKSQKKKDGPTQALTSYQVSCGVAVCAWWFPRHEFRRGSEYTRAFHAHAHAQLRGQNVNVGFEAALHS